MSVLVCSLEVRGMTLIPTVQMESQHSIGVPTSRDFPRFVIISHISWPEVGSRSRWYQKRALLENCGKILKISFQMDSPPLRSMSCVQISWNLDDQKSVKSCVTYRTKKNQKSARSRFCADRAQNLPGPAANVLTVPQISSKSVHVWRSYSRTCEHRSNAPQSVSNTRRSFSFFAE